MTDFPEIASVHEGIEAIKLEIPDADISPNHSDKEYLAHVLGQINGGYIEPTEKLLKLVYSVFFLMTNEPTRENDREEAKFLTILNSIAPDELK